MQVTEQICSACGLIKPSTDFNSRNRKCRPCRNQVTYAWKRRNHARVLENNRRWRKENRAARLASERRWRAKNRDEHYAKIKAWRKEHWEEIKPKMAAHQAVRIAQKLRAMPKWANAFFIEEAYELAKLRAESTGYKWSVDHIVPLISKKVCGLHTHTNIRVIPASVNSSKGNRHWPDMPEGV